VGEIEERVRREGRETKRVISETKESCVGSQCSSKGTFQESIKEKAKFDESTH